MLPVLVLEYLHFPHNDGLIHTHRLPNSQAAIVQVVDWDLVCDRTALLSTGNSCFVKINGKLLSQYLHNQLDLIIA